MMKPRFFKSPSAFRKWLAANHAKAKELWVGFYKKDSGKPSITWPESVDEALCFGWIDGVRKRIDAESYMIRFSPRKPSLKGLRCECGQRKNRNRLWNHDLGRRRRSRLRDAGLRRRY